MSAPNVLRVNTVEEETAFLQAVHETISRILQQKAGRTLIDIAEDIGVEAKTVSNAFNKKHRLSHTFLNRLGIVYGPDVLDPVAKLAGARMVAIEKDGRHDILPFVARVNLKIAEARDPESHTGTRENHIEKAGYLPDLRALRRELDLLIADVEAELAA